jgi:hypothetical protein
MSVSRQHERLVEHLVQWLNDRYAGRGDFCLYADHIDMLKAAKPLSIGDYLPDVYGVGLSSPLTVIGEAETNRSIDDPHAADQIGAFIDFLTHRPCPVLVIAVPWAAVPRARGLVRNALRRRGNPAIETFCLERLE